MIRRPPRSTLDRSSAASDVYKRQPLFGKSTDSGINWDFTSFYLNTNEGKATSIEFTDINTGIITASVWDGTGAISKTTDGGINWITTMFPSPVNDAHFPISNASLRGYAAVSYTHLTLPTSDLV